MLDAPATDGKTPRSGTRILRVLVADDDPASRRFLADGLRSLGADPHACADGAAALAHARSDVFDLLLLDCRMPGGGARQILEALRSDPTAASSDSVAVATSAEVGPGDRQQLLAAGFGEVLQKPCDLRSLQRVLALVQAGGCEAPLLDDDAALVSTGDARTMHALRGLLREELASLCGELDRLGADPGGFAERLHRLRSSCGFCGAAALSAQVIALQQRLAQGQPVAPLPVQRFREALLATLDALEPSD
ncbi:response regulator [Frateuria sp. Soil773]|uniref:response regulator n=1 Tax=Frateuria sp. Soil773 TaxID=1736407 RepID=UPI000A50496E|nr:response regulator [Frateuria sp. Soil773]